MGELLLLGRGEYAVAIVSDPHNYKYGVVSNRSQSITMTTSRDGGTQIILERKPSLRYSEAKD